MKAIVMAGGKGTRLMPLTAERPKPMVPIIDTPILEYIVLHLKRHGFFDIAFTLGYMADAIKNHFGDGQKFGVKITHFVEKTPLGTAGGVKACERFLCEKPSQNDPSKSEDFLVTSGDAFTDIDLSELFSVHKKCGGIGTLAVKKVPDARQFGVVKSDRKGLITEFVEKPQNITEAVVNTGIYAFKHEILSKIPKGVSDFSRDIFPMLLGSLYAHEAEGFWSDIGTLPAYYGANLYVAERPSEFGFLL